MPAVLMAQSIEDSSSIIEELTLDESDEEAEPPQAAYENYYFIRKEDRTSTWKPAAQHNIPDTVTTALKEEDAFWYADIAEKKPDTADSKKRGTPLGMQPWFRTLIWLVIISVFLIFLFIYLAGSNVRLFRKKNVVIEKSDHDAMPEDIFLINYQREIAKAAAAGNYRLAVRLHFLQLLKNMSENGIISYKQDKTNFDYLSELHTTEWYKQFFKVTRNYEYSWYGQFEIAEEAYRSIRNDFDLFENQLSKTH